MKRIIPYLVFLTLLVNSVSAQQKSAKETLELQKNLVTEGKISELWKMAPLTWRQRVEADIKNIVLELPLEKRKDIFELLILWTNLIKDKESLLTDAMMANNAFNLNEKEARKSIIGFGLILDLLIKSQLAEQAQFSKFNLDKFIAEKGDKIVKELLSSPFYNAGVKKVNGKSIIEFLQELKKVKVEGEAADLRLVSEKLNVEMKMKQIDKVWVPGAAVEYFDEYSKNMDLALASMKEKPENFMFMDMIIEGFKQQLKTIREAKNIDELMAAQAGPAVDHGAIDREREYQQVQAVTLGKTLSKKIKKKSKCLVIHYPVLDANRKDVDRIIAAFKEGLGKKVTEVKSAPIKVIKNPDDLMEEAMIENTAEDFNKVIKANKEYDVVIIMVPLPNAEEEIYAMDIFKMIEDPKKPGFWIKDPKIKYPIVGVFNGYIGNLEPIFQEGLIHAMTLWKPDPEIDEEDVPKDIQKAFNKRYLTVTPDNLKEIKKKYRILFPKVRE